MKLTASVEKMRNRHVSILVAGCVLLVILSFNSACAETKEILSQQEKEILDSDDVDRIKDLLDAKWKLFSSSDRKTQVKEQFVSLFAEAAGHRSRKVRLVSLNYLSNLNSQNHVVNALAELRQACFARESRAIQIELFAVVQSFLRNARLARPPEIGGKPLPSEEACIEEMKAAANYRNQLLQAMLSSGNVKSIPTEMLLTILKEGLKTSSDVDCRLVQGALMELAERQDVQGFDELVTSAEQSAVRVAVKGNPEHYPIRASAATAKRIHSVLLAEDKTAAVNEALKGILTEKTEQDECIFLWSLDYAWKKRLVNVIPVLKEIESDPRLPVKHKERVQNYIRALSAQ